MGRDMKKLFTAPHLPHLPHWHLDRHRLHHIKKAHAVAQLSYLASELIGFHPIHDLLVCVVMAGGMLFLWAGTEPIEIGV